MTKEQQKDLFNKETERMIWQTVFCNDDGKAVLAQIMNKLGAFSQDPHVIDPNLIAVSNWILSKIGILTIPNLNAYVSAIVDSNSGKDIENLRRKYDGKITDSI